MRLSFAGFCPFEGRDEMSFVGQGVLLGCWEFVVSVGRDGHGRGGAAKAVADAAVVLGAADQDADGFVVIIAFQDIIDQGDIEVELPCIFGAEAASFEFDDDVPELLNVEEQQIDVVVVSVDVEVYLPADERETGAKFL